MRSFSNIMPNFADKLHLLVDSICKFQNKEKPFLFWFFFVFSYLFRNFGG